MIEISSLHLSSVVHYDLFCLFYRFQIKHSLQYIQVTIYVENKPGMCGYGWLLIPMCRSHG